MTPKKEGHMMNLESKLIDFARWAITEHRSNTFGDLDGGSIQDKLEELGLLVEVEVSEPCGESCTCVEYGEFPQTCLRLAEGVILT